MRLSLFLFATFLTVHCSCPVGFELVRGGECRGLYTTVNSNYNAATGLVVNKCAEIPGGKPVIIHDAEHQAYWKARVPGSDYLFLGLICNTSSKKWQWSDGSPLDYRPPGYDPALNQSCSTGQSWDMHPDGYWSDAYGTASRTVNIFCTVQLKTPPSRDGCDGADEERVDGTCYQVRANAVTWQDAQATCRNVGATVASIHSAEANQFIRRAAVTQGAVNGLYIGATSSANRNQFSWIDGSLWDYQNYYPGFPVAGHGECLAMDTFSNSGEWMNIDCSSRMGVACARKAQNKNVCSSGPWQQGQVIFSPGYPYDASEPCDYFLTVPAGKRVRVQVLVLEANTCCDRLVMEDNVLAGNVVANLTGEITDKVYTTISSNFMRVSWQPKGGVNVRGAIFTYTAV